jgi:4-amino-4-deoxy-L-arabinose transferase-like glycosyltransferase
MSSSAPTLPFTPKVMILLLAYLVVLKLAISFLMQPLGDEAYYWLWGQNPSLSYFDHPGLAGWTLGIADAIFGTNLIGLRIGSVFTTIGSAYVVWLYAKRFAPAKTRETWLYLCLMIAASPTLFVWMTLVYHDHLLIFLTLASIYLFTTYFAQVIDEQPKNHATLYAAALFLGFAGLTKYSAIFLGLAVAALVLLHPKLRRLWRRTI